jgi:hypothetical protein
MLVAPYGTAKSHIPEDSDLQENSNELECHGIVNFKVENMRLLFLFST